MVQQISDILSKELEQLKADIIRRHEEAGQVASGRTRASFEVKVSDSNGQLLGNSYAGVLERGRRGGKVPYDFKDILLRWAEAKGIYFANNTDARRWAWFVTQKIRREGTALYRSGQTVDIFTTPIDEMTERLAKKLAGLYTNEITNTI
jgi:hypothetical protein